MKKIPLTRGMETIVDDSMYKKLSTFKWHAKQCGNKFYAVRSQSKNKPRDIYMHREIMSHPMGMEIDHKNHNSLDNRICNLRLCTKAQNQWNMNKKSIRGWKMKNGKWTIQFHYNGRRIHLGSFGTQEEADFAWRVASSILYGPYLSS